MGIALELLKLGRKGGPDSWANMKIGKAKISPSTWYDDQYWAPPPKGIMSVQFEARSSVLAESRTLDSLTIDVSKKQISNIDEDHLSRLLQKCLVNANAITRSDVLAYIRLLAVDHWFSYSQIEQLAAALPKEEASVHLSISLLPKLSDTYQLSTETGKPNFISHVDHLSEFGAATFVGICGYSMLHNSGHYVLDLSIEAEREKCKRLLTYDFIQSFYPETGAIKIE